MELIKGRIGRLLSLSLLYTYCTSKLLSPMVVVVVVVDSIVTLVRSFLAIFLPIVVWTRRAGLQPPPFQPKRITSSLPSV